jgi:hypothetical protein
MPTQPRTHSGATQIVTEILKDTAKPRQAVSVKKALRKMRPALVAPETLDENNGGKAEAVKARVSR